ncbi:DUF4267 domain-containing protein [Pseudonocardia sp. GCM10023141]|uniref:DUF4267 domain-containing protein n=1 Tax=Pseudonocardia sp. GCM10023141 TaxID=3252653 RepID=UPI00360B4149
MTIAAYALAGLIAAGIIYVGAAYLFAPARTAAGFGVPSPPAANPFYAVKGVRDIASGLITLALMVFGGPHLLGVGLLALAVIPIGDMVIVLRSGGTRKAALGIHGATAAVMIVIAAVLLSA